MKGFQDEDVLKTNEVKQNKQTSDEITEIEKFSGLNWILDKREYCAECQRASRSRDAKKLLPISQETELPGTLKKSFQTKTTGACNSL